MKLTFRFLVFSAVSLLLAASAFAQGRGNLSGVVRDENGHVLPGAAVFVKGGTLGTSTDINGAYLLQGIPAGNVDISVSYMGYETQTFEVYIVSGQTESFNVTLSELVRSIEAVTVTAAIEGQQRALNQQKNAPNLMQVLSADQIGLFPDLNVADALKRVSGITSDGSTISLRGTPANFTNINVNGEQIMSNQEGGLRNASLDFIPSDILSSMEVQKTLLPSNDGDASAGVINMRTGEARSLTRSIKVDAGVGYYFLRQKVSGNGKIGISQRFNPTARNMAGTWGVAANYSYNNSYSGYDRIEAESWQLSNIREYDNGTVGDYLDSRYMPTDFRYRYQTQQSVRQGVSLVVDWAPSLNTKFTLSTLFNQRKNEATRYRNRFRFRGNNDPALLPEEIPLYYYMVNTDGYADGTYGANRVMSVTQVSDIRTTTNNFSVNLEGKTTIKSWQIDGGIAWTHTGNFYKSEMDGFQTPEWRFGYRPRNSIQGLNYEAEAITGTRPTALEGAKYQIIATMPSISTQYLSMQYRESAFPSDQGYIGTFDAINHYNLYVIENWNHNTIGQNLTAKLNASYNYFIGENASTFSFGGKGKFMFNKGVVPGDAINYEVVPSLGGAATNRYSLYENPFEMTLDRFLYKEQLESKFLGGNLAFGPVADIGKIRDYVKANTAPNGHANVMVNEYSTGAARDGFNYESDEKIGAFYAMNKIQFRKVMLLGGFRVEANRVEYKANELFRYNRDYDPDVNSGQAPGTASGDFVYNAYRVTPRDSSMTYTMFLPNLQARIDATDRTIVRAAWTTGYSRPQIQALLPKADIDTENSRVVAGNPNLKAAYVHNLDLMAEHYTKNVGLLSGGFFYKHINNFIYIEDSPLDPNSPYAHAANKLQTSRNGDAAKVYGFEMTLNSPLTFLPGFLKNLVFTGNYTIVRSDAYVNEERGSMRLPGQANNTANLAIAYSSKLFTVQAAWNYIGEYIMQVGSDADQDVWLAGRWQMDINGSVQLYKNLSFWVEASNILNREAFQYFGDRSRVYQLQYSGTYGRAGFSYRF